MRSIGSWYETLLKALAWVAGALLFVIFILIALNVTLRWLFNAPLSFAEATVEYAQIYFTVFAAPLLTRQKAHVAIDVVIRFLSPPVRVYVAKVACLLSAITMSWFAVVALQLAINAAVEGATDIRGITLPLWLSYAPLPIGFGLVAVEFIRQFFAPAVDDSAAQLNYH
jgi:TRAP-type C4-dicarboxylate transport system permease small subunit